MIDKGRAEKEERGEERLVRPRPSLGSWKLVVGSWKGDWSSCGADDANNKRGDDEDGSQVEPASPNVRIAKEGIERRGEEHKDGRIVAGGIGFAKWEINRLTKRKLTREPQDNAFPVIELVGEKNSRERKPESERGI